MPLPVHCRHHPRESEASSQGEACLGLGVWVAGIEVSGPWCWGLGFGVHGVRFTVWALELGVQGLGLRIQEHRFQDCASNMKPKLDILGRGTGVPHS